MGVETSQETGQWEVLSWKKVNIKLIYLKARASYEIDLYVVLATKPLLSFADGM